MATAINFDDLRRGARRRIPKIFFDYIDGGANSGTTFRNNTLDFDRWTLRQSVLRGFSAADLGASFLGHAHKLPLMLGPVGFAGMYHRRGEIAAARAADAAGIAQCLSTFSICSLEDVAAAKRGPLYFQLYVFKDRSLTEDMIARARAAKVDTLFLTVDTPVTPMREQDERNGFRARTVPSPGMLLGMMMRPRWCLEMAPEGMPKVGNVSRYSRLGQWVMDQSANLSHEIDPNLTWDDVAWFRKNWEGRLVIKGILSADDARRSADHGADAVLVSNHGGRQLDPAASTISVLPSVAAAVGDRIEVLFDGGVQRGAHVIKALALGAHGVSLGRMWAFGLGAGGEAGVSRALHLLAQEIQSTLVLMGFRSVAELRAAGAEALSERQARLPLS